MSYNIRVGLLAGAMFFVLPADAAQKELSEVRQQIQETRQNIKSQKQSLASLQQQLKADEQAISTLARRLDAAESRLGDTRAQLRKLEAQGQALAKQARRQEQLLAQQVEHAYHMGQHDYLKLLLNQQNPAAIGRAIDYYGYINQARLQILADINQTREQLASNREQTRAATRKLAELVEARRADQAALQQKQQQRAATASELRSSLEADQQQLSQLQAAEKEMLRQIEIARKRLEAERRRRKAEALARARAKARAEGQSERAAQARAEASFASVDRHGLGKLHGRLPWPARGRLLRQFGERRSGEVTWKGILIGAAEGAPVRAIASGDVVYADWLAGFGNVLVIDHGHGYLTLYGNNQSLLKQAGSAVKAGERVALVGRSGGQSESGLYFEIRRQGQALDPASWLAR